jgi:hypothetical protein
MSTNINGPQTTPLIALTAFVRASTNQILQVQMRPLRVTAADDPTEHAAHPWFCVFFSVVTARHFDDLSAVYPAHFEAIFE